MFSKRHYQAIADALRKHVGEEVEKVSYPKVMIVVELADTFEKDNPRFDRARFIEACGLGIPQPKTYKVKVGE